MSTPETSVSWFFPGIKMSFVDNGEVLSDTKKMKTKLKYSSLQI